MASTILGLGRGRHPKEHAVPDVTVKRGRPVLSRDASAVATASACSGSGPPSTLRVVVLVPAYNEAEAIEATLDGIMHQTRMPDLVVVIPNGCKDDTARGARKYPARVRGP